MSARVTLALLALIAACGPPPQAPDDAMGPREARVGVVSAAASRALDVLFVVDNTTNEDQQTGLAATFPELLAALDELDGALPDVHLGVISSDLGAGDFGITNCVGEGDEGQLQVQARVAACTPPTGAFIVNVSDGAGGRTTNYDGDLADVFACIAQLGTNGCGFEQHLESMRRALDGSNLFNAGFLRPEAHLLVVILADEDDCSADDLAMFDSLDDPSGPLGALSSFRCFEFGVDCEVGNDDPRAPGLREGCHAREDSPYMFGVREYAELLRSLKAGPQIMVTAIVGDPTPVAVGTDPERPERAALLQSCASAGGSADPGVRLAELAAAFPARGHVYSVCADDYTPMLRDIGERTIEAIGTTCLAGDLSGDLGALEATCTVSDVLDLDSAAEQRTAIPRCATTGDVAPCFRFEVDTRCQRNDAQAAVIVERVAAPPAGTVTVVDCLVP